MKPFAQIVASFINTKKKQRFLADKFEVSLTTTQKWANGTARPHPKVQHLIVKFIEEQKGEL